MGLFEPKLTFGALLKPSLVLGLYRVQAQYLVLFEPRPTIEVLREKADTPAFFSSPFLFISKYLKSRVTQPVRRVIKPIAA